MPTTTPDGQIVKPKNRAYAIEQMLESQKGRLAKLLPDAGLTPDRLIRTAVVTMRQNPDLMACTTGSVVAGIVQCAALGLEIGTGLGHAYLVPFTNKGKKEATLIIGYKGFCDMAYRSGKVVSVHARAVYDGDLFDWQEGLERFLNHKRVATDRKPETLTHVYAIATMKDVEQSQSPFVVLDREDIEKVRKTSRASASRYSPWNTHYEMMARKTAVRRLVDKGEVPASAEMTKAAALDEAADANLNQVYPDVPHSIFDIDDWEEEGEIIHPPEEA